MSRLSSAHRTSGSAGSVRLSIAVEDLHFEKVKNGWSAVDSVNFGASELGSALSTIQR